MKIRRRRLQGSPRPNVRDALDRASKPLNGLFSAGERGALRRHAAPGHLRADGFRWSRGDSGRFSCRPRRASGRRALLLGELALAGTWPDPATSPPRSPLVAYRPRRPRNANANRETVQSSVAKGAIAQILGIGR